ncbi:hypothetical protein VB711_16215 [Cronbergia sp. UHCC 0137]|uniref:hypothetical protein n=1 Tax=Cronbergia sp. UHCC 0137 TaxID=3110239 RepID=UPI002B20C512|nr:hypothetical protein [Cronbergia sp. UHCC 0137]MEA5619374.1 hypothetical protein [Cronbergia sp. UHCC 0137]
MKKQKLILSISLVLMIFSSLVVSSGRAIGGKAGAKGVIPGAGSESFTGNSFNRTNDGSVRGLFGRGALPEGVSITGSGSNIIITITNQAILARLSAAANGAINDASIPGATLSTDGKSLVIVLAQGGAGSDVALTQLQEKIATSTGVNPELIGGLIQALLGVLNSSEPVAQLAPAQSTASIKDLKIDSVISQESGTANVNVDVNKLNAAINAYNKVVLESSPVILQKLSQDPDFLEIGRTLRGLRAALQLAVS